MGASLMRGGWSQFSSGPRSLPHLGLCNLMDNSVCALGPLEALALGDKAPFQECKGVSLLLLTV